MNAHPALYPAFAMALLTLCVWLRLLVSRVSEMKRRRIHPQSVATSAQIAERLGDSRASDNFRNLFELPVLFYVALVVADATGTTDALTIALSWAFVAFRYGHSLIQCSYNRVMHRFVVYVAGGVLLWALWGVLAMRVLKT